MSDEYFIVIRPKSGNEKFYPDNWSGYVLKGKPLIDKLVLFKDGPIPVFRVATDVEDELLDKNPRKVSLILFGYEVQDYVDKS